MKTLCPILDDNSYMATTLRLGLACVVFVMGEKAFLAFVQRSNPGDSTSYGYFGALDRKMGQFGEWIGGWIIKVWTFCPSCSPGGPLSTVAEASPPHVRTVWSPSLTFIAILLTNFLV